MPGMPGDGRDPRSRRRRRADKADESPSAEVSRAESLRRRAASDAFARGLSAADKP